jgi:flavin reductase (DIM6/NTAB) family NADH-FMN oxidoreductase RutF
MKIAKKSFPLSKVYGLLEPGPVVMVTTKHRQQANVMTMSWHIMMEFEPPLVGCIISGSHLSFDILMATKECVIAIPSVELAAVTVKVGNVSGRKTDKFKKFGLTMMPASFVAAPLIKECYANLECKVVDTSWVKKYKFFVVEVCKALVNPAIKNPCMIHHRNSGVFAVDGKIIKLASKAK